MSDASSRQTSPYHAGAASIVVTPDAPMWMAGYAVRKGPSQGKLTELHARALALREARSGEQPLVMVSMDLIAAPASMVDPVAKMVREHYGIPRERLLFAASHTHYGPEVRADKVPFFEIPEEFAAKIPGYVERLQGKLVEVIGRAIDRMAPATLEFARSTATFAQNRRPGSQAHDHEVPVLIARDAGEKTPIAFVFGYACHNTTINPLDRRWCGDWAGYAASELEAKHPGSVALFITGAGGDQNPTPRGTVELSQKYGGELSAAVVAAERSEDAIRIDGRLGASLKDVALAFDVPTREEMETDAAGDDRIAARKAKLLLEQLQTRGKLINEYPLRVQAIDFGGEALLIAIGGEIVIDWALSLKQTYGSDRAVWVSGYCNDMIGYVPTRRIQLEGGYEGGEAMKFSSLPGPFAEDVEQRVREGVASIVRDVLRS